MKEIKLSLFDRLAIMVIGALSRNDFSKLNEFINSKSNEELKEIVKAFEEIENSRFSNEVRYYATFAKAQILNWLLDN